MSIKFLKREKMDRSIFLVEWDTGYIQIWEDWSQYLSPKRYNWLNFRPIWFEIDYDKLAGEHFSIELGLMGFNLRFHQFIKQNQRGRKLEKSAKELESIEEACRKEVKKLKSQIKALEKRLKEG
ncbi:MAG: hypothetical protein A2784_01785 [Candidatus Chisholmbacteria bacterium RIFCSPHIGHO2_01_FULL_48_12]|uniref:Uncharacterized protein n=2 Tax=Microgenomates group TaxID=1794810 RepID=A0A1G1VRB4_9BACT|nr:MAG: hypothetical protein A3F03_04900 [Candidatus Roizmanbacteria bacterium RIFCSPHIGHO2_12_FULL_41_11]OGY17910.1 MAG: hypothetical protein A2784_01785 [Candidatus Chisholmbacteria bacterium RIFCSPHIGHO2_01_FULL_48_12]